MKPTYDLEVKAAELRVTEEIPVDPGIERIAAVCGVPGPMFSAAVQERIVRTEVELRDTWAELRCLEHRLDGLPSVSERLALRFAMTASVLALLILLVSR